MPHDVEFFGESYRLNPPELYQWEMLEFADAATSGADSDLLSGIGAVYKMLRAAIHPDDWERFRSTAKTNHATVREHLMPVVVEVFTQPTGRPTGLPSDSSDGQRSTPENSGDDSYSRVIAREEAAGRPDRALMVLMSQEASAA